MSERNPLGRAARSLAGQRPFRASLHLRNPIIFPAASNSLPILPQGCPFSRRREFRHFLSTTLSFHTRQHAFTPPSATLFHAQPISGQPATPSSPLPLYLFAIPRSSSSFFSLPTVGRRIQRFTQRPVHGCEIFLPALAYLLLPGSC